MGCLKLHTDKSYTQLKIVYRKSSIQVNNKETTDTNQMFTQRGYTGHEHFYKNGIIHMNGRIYDPMLRTFLSPDVNLLDPENSQHYNRYSYGLKTSRENR